MGCVSVRSCEKKLPGMWVMDRPSQSLTCDNAISTAMPLVKPMTMLTGTKRTSVPSRKNPSSSTRPPAAARADHRLAPPVALDNVVDDDDEGPRRPADLGIGAAQGRDQKAGNDGRPQPGPGRQAAGNRKRHGQWQRHDADGNARAHIGQPAASVVAAQRVQQPGMECK